MESRGFQGTWTTGPTETTKKDSWELREIEAAIAEHTWVCTRSSACVLVICLVFCGVPDNGRVGVSESFCLLVGCLSYWLASCSLGMRVCAWCYCTSLAHVGCYPWGSSSFLGRNGGGRDLGRRKLRVTGRSGRRESFSWAVLYERIINQNK